MRALKALGDVYKDFRFVPTGGISAQNVRDDLGLPIVLGCGGSWMCPPAAIAAGRFDEIEKVVREAVALVPAS